MAKPEDQNSSLNDSSAHDLLSKQKLQKTQEKIGMIKDFKNFQSEMSHLDIKNIGALDKKNPTKKDTTKKLKMKIQDEANKVEDGLSNSRSNSRQSNPTHNKIKPDSEKKINIVKSGKGVLGFQNHPRIQNNGKQRKGKVELSKRSKV